MLLVLRDTSTEYPKTYLFIGDIEYNRFLGKCTNHREIQTTPSVITQSENPCPNDDLARTKPALFVNYVG